MAYADLITQENINQQFLAVLMPKRRAASWTPFSGSVWSQSFDYGHVSSVTVNGVALTQGVNTSLSAGQFLYDDLAGILYIRLSDSSDPNAQFVVNTYELYVGTFDANWHRDPLDVTSLPVYFEPLIAKSPTIKESTSDQVFGYLPTQSSSLTLSNGDHTLERHIYDSSFSAATIRIYHWLAMAGEVFDPDPANMKLIYDGVMGDVKYTEQNVTITTYDRIDRFGQDFVAKAAQVFSTSDFPNLDPNFLLAQIRYVYGVVDGFSPANIDYNDQAPSTSNNREYACIGEQNNLNDISRQVAGSPSSTTTRTYLTTAQGIQIGDSVWFDRNVGTDEYALITNVNYSSNYVEHAALVSPMASGDHLRRSFVGHVKIVQNSVIYTALYKRDYDERPTQAAGCSGFLFNSSMESNLGMSTLQPTDTVFCRVYGRNNDVGFGGNDPQTGNLTNAMAILYDLMVNFLGIPASSVDLAGFTSVAGTVSDALGFAIPETAHGSAPTFKDIVIELLNSCLCKLYVDNNNKWTVSAIAPISTAPISVGNDEIARDTFNYSFEYRDLISDVFVDFYSQEQVDGVSAGASNSVTATSNIAKYLHGIVKQMTVNSYHIRTADAQRLANRLAFILGERKGTVDVSLTNRFFESLINDRIQVSRERLPGFAFVLELERQRNMAVIELERSLKNVKITMDDQLGINQNSGSW